jgi:O-antigen/teichoic acid export membrane protein
LLDKLKPKSEFSRNVLTLMTGTTIAQAIPIAISPILTRIYTPEDFGIFALYMSLVSIIAVVATGRYELAIMLPKKDEDAINIVALSILISFFVSFIALLIVFFFNAQITSLLGNPEISSWLYFIPITVLLTGIYQSFNYWSNRKKQYKRLATSRVIQSGTTATTNLGMGFGRFGSSGLILGGVLGQGVATGILGRLVWREDGDKLVNIKKLKIFALAKRYKEHPKFLIFSHGLAVVYQQIPILYIGKFFDISMLGFFSLANRFISLPGSLIANAIGDVFREQATEQYHKTGEFKNIFINTLLKTFTLSILPFVVLFLTIDDIFSFVFGSEWRIAGEYGKILMISAYISFVITPIDKAALIVNDIAYILRWHIGKFIGNVLLVGFSFYFELSIIEYLYGIVILNIIFHVYDLYKEYKFSKGKK